MKFSESWLREWVNPANTSDELAHQITMAGLEVDGVDPVAGEFTGIVVGGGKLSQGRALMLSFIYVQGMALTYTLLGLVVASAGMQFQAAMQHPLMM